MSVPRTELQFALDELVANQEGMRFQGLAVILAKLHWPDLVASERSQDLGLDAHSPASVSPDGIEKGFACSITAELAKIRLDIQGARRHFPGLKVLIFATPKVVSKQRAERWADSIEREFGVDLIIMSREDIISALQMPQNADLCAIHLGLSVPPTSGTDEQTAIGIGIAAAVLIRNWSSRLANKPLIDLRSTPASKDRYSSRPTCHLTDLYGALLVGRRLIIEAPAGRGKTTTLIQLAQEHVRANVLSFLVDLPRWVRSGVQILTYLAGTPEFQASQITGQQLATICNGRHVTFLLNGWNEIAGTESDQASSMMQELERTFPKAGIAVATRTHPIKPPLAGGEHYRLEKLTEDQRKTYLRERLQDDADGLLTRIGHDPVLQDLTQTPLVLSEVASLWIAGRHVPPSKIGVLNACVGLLEDSPEHLAALESAPLVGRARFYLEELACNLVDHGTAHIGEVQARAVIADATLRLKAERQIVADQEPYQILTALSSHHIVERSTYPDVTLSFLHQQFQELFAALRLARDCAATGEGQYGMEPIIKRCLNEPAWTEPVTMLAASIGTRTYPGGEDVAAIGAKLVRGALHVDAVFAAELAHLCGASVWSEIRDDVGTRLRALYKSEDAVCRSIGLAAMMASGFEDFADVIEPLLTSDDQQIRLRTYRITHSFHLSSLGQDWPQRVSNWREELRSEFYSETIHQRRPPADLVSIALSDPSAAVRRAAVSALWWIGGPEEAERLFIGLSQDLFEETIDEFPTEYIGKQVAQRASAFFTARAKDSLADLGAQLHCWRKAAELGGEEAVRGLKSVLDKSNGADVAGWGQYDLEPALEHIQQADFKWVSQWVAKQILSGTLSSERWSKFVKETSLSERTALVERAGFQDLGDVYTSGVVRFLQTFAGADDARELFRRLCELSPILRESVYGDDKEPQRKLRDQILFILRGMNAELAIDATLDEAPRLDRLTALRVFTALFHSSHVETTELREQLTDPLQERVRIYLTENLDTVLADEDFSGDFKAEFAMLLGEVGTAADLVTLEALIRADLVRMELGRKAREADYRSKQGQYAQQHWAVWYVNSALRMALTEAPAFLMKFLAMPDYEEEVGWGLVQVSTGQAPAVSGWQPARAMGIRDPRSIWKARDLECAGFSKPNRKRFAGEVRRHFERLGDGSILDSNPTSLNLRRKRFAAVLAAIDAQASAPLLLEAFPEGPRTRYLEDGWQRIHVLEGLLAGGVVLEYTPTLAILEPVFEHCRDRRWSGQSQDLMSRALVILLFTDNPKTGLVKVEESLQTTRLHVQGMRLLIRMIGLSRSSDGIGLLRRLAEEQGVDSSYGEVWMDAVSELDTPGARQLLLSFVDPSLPAVPRGVLQNHEDHLAAKLVAICRKDKKTLDRLIELAAERLSGERKSVLARVFSGLGTEEALIASLGLLGDDEMDGYSSYELLNRIETTFVARVPIRDHPNAYTQKPRSANRFRERLFEIWKSDPHRRKAALRLLRQIEDWRMSHGRPNGEPRNPGYNEGMIWPPCLPKADDVDSLE